MGKAASQITKRYSDWLAGCFLAAALSVLYITIRPPLFDRDGYVYRLMAQSPGWLLDAIPHHLLWIPLQRILFSIFYRLGYKTTAPFQIYGIVMSCTVLLFFFWLLLETSRTRRFALAAVLLVAFSPGFWYLTLQNQPYPLVFLAIVLYLRAWHTLDRRAPTGPRLLAAGVCLAGAILMQQGVAFLVAAGALALLLSGSDAFSRRLVRAVTWSAGITAMVLPAYVLIWALAAAPRISFWNWITLYLRGQHAIQFRFPESLIKAVMGLTGALIQSHNIQALFEEKFSPTATLACYSAFGIVLVAAATALFWRSAAGPRLIRLVQTDSLFAVSVFSVVFWSVFVILWEPVTSYYWVLTFFPGLLCLGLLFRNSAECGLKVFAAVVVFLVGWNGYFNRGYDAVSSRNFPEPLVAAIEGHLGQRDVFIVLGHEDWYGEMNYDLLFACLRARPRNPGLSILDDFVLPSAGQAWPEKLRHAIDATVDSGGRVFVAAHVFDPRSYQDLANNADPYDPFFQKQMLTLSGPILYEQVRGVLAAYARQDSDLKVGEDGYFVLKRR